MKNLACFELLQSLSENAWQQDLETGAIRTSASFWKALGYDADSGPLIRGGAEKLLHPIDAELAAEEVALHVRSEEPFELEFRLLAFDQEWHFIRLRGCITDWNNNGKPAVIGGILNDVTNEVVAARAHGNAQALIATLSSRERRVLGCLVAGAANKNIAHGMSLSRRTVEGYRARIMVKMGVRGVGDLVQLARAGGVTREREADCGLT